MSISHSAASPHRSVDATGRALPMTEEEVKARAPEIARRLAALDDMGSEEEQRETYNTLMKALNSDPLNYRNWFH